MERLSPQPVVSVWALAVEKTSTHHREHPGTRTGHPDATPWSDGRRPAGPPTQPHTGWNSIRPSLLSIGSPASTTTQNACESIPSRKLARGGEERCCAERSCTQSVSPATGPVTCHRRGPAVCAPHGTPRGFLRVSFSPYFSSSLTLSIRGAVSPARHVLTRPRPHPFFRQQGQRTPVPLFRRSAGRVGEDQRCRVCTNNSEAWPSTVVAGLRRWPAGSDHVSHSPAPWQSRGRAGMLC